MSMHNTKVVVVDDDSEIRDLIATYLREEGFIAFEARDGARMREVIGAQRPDAVLLDLKLPGEDGLTLARELRQTRPDMIILMISGKEDVVDRVAGLEVGADDYIVKPLHLREVLARLRSALRRRDSLRDGAVAPAGEPGAGKPGGMHERRYSFAGWTLDIARRTLQAWQGGFVELTTGEFDLLAAFVTHPNRALTRDQLLDYARHRGGNGFDRSIDVQVGRLRRKIEPNPKRPAMIKTVRNVGYMLCATVTVHDGGYVHRSPAPEESPTMPDGREPGSPG